MNATGTRLITFAIFTLISSYAALCDEPNVGSFPHNGVTAHRGNSGEHPENTIPAFKSGIEIGADRIYTDYPGRLLVLEDEATFRSTNCEGTYPHHLQGICTNEQDAIYWSFTTTLVKTDTQGKILAKTPVANHHGDLCFHDGKVYVAVNLGELQ